MRFPTRPFQLIPLLLVAGTALAQVQGFKLVEHTFKGVSCDYTLYVDKDELKRGDISIAYALPRKITMLPDAPDGTRTGTKHPIGNLKQLQFAGSLRLEYPEEPLSQRRGNCEDELRAISLGKLPGFPRRIVSSPIMNIGLRLEQLYGVKISEKTPLMFASHPPYARFLSTQGVLTVRELLSEQDSANVAELRGGLGPTRASAYLYLPPGMPPISTKAERLGPFPVNVEF
jgi:hypothetical protein